MMIIKNRCVKELDFENLLLVLYNILISSNRESNTLCQEEPDSGCQELTKSCDNSST